MANTKQHILDVAMQLFNEQGIINVRLQHIADKVGISVGNLAYHFPSKKVMVETIHDQISELLEPVFSKSRSFQSLIDFDNQLSVYYHFAKSYSFYFLDLLEIERGYPQMHAARINQLDAMIGQIETWLNQSVDSGLLRLPLAENFLRQLAETIWMVIHFWSAQLIIRGLEDESEGNYKSMVWSIIQPHFTEMGQSEYEMIILPNIINYK